VASDLGDSYAVILHEPANYLRSHRRQSGYRALLARHNFSTPSRFHLRMQFVQLVNSVFSSRFLNVSNNLPSERTSEILAFTPPPCTTAHALDGSPVRLYSSRQRKRVFKFPIGIGCSGKVGPAGNGRRALSGIDYRVVFATAAIEVMVELP